MRGEGKGLGVGGKGRRVGVKSQTSLIGESSIQRV